MSEETPETAADTSAQDSQVDEVESIDARLKAATLRDDTASDGQQTPKCSSGHLMVVSSDYSAYSGTMYRCDACGIGDGKGARWFCSICKEDFCFKCHPAVSTFHFVLISSF